MSKVKFRGWNVNRLFKRNLLIRNCKKIWNKNILNTSLTFPLLRLHLQPLTFLESEEYLSVKLFRFNRIILAVFLFLSHDICLITKIWIIKLFDSQNFRSIYYSQMIDKSEIFTLTYSHWQINRKTSVILYLYYTSLSALWNLSWN